MTLFRSHCNKKKKVFWESSAASLQITKIFEKAFRRNVLVDATRKMVCYIQIVQEKKQET